MSGVIVNADLRRIVKKKWIEKEVKDALSWQIDQTDKENNTI